MSRSALVATVIVAFALGGLLSVGEHVVGRDFTFSQDPAERAAEFAADPAATNALGLMFILSQIALLVGLVALVPLLPRGRGMRTTVVGVALFLVGLAAHLVTGGINFTIALLGAEGHTEASVAAFQTADASAFLLPFFAAGMIGFALGFITLGAGLYRARVIPLGVAVLFWLAIPLEFALGGLSALAGLAGRLVFLAALVGGAYSLRKAPPAVDAGPTSA